MAGYGTKFGMDFVLEVVNGNGIEDQDIFDSDKYKSFVYRVAQSFWKDNIRIGFIGYTGKEEGAGGLTNSVTYFGPDMRVRLPNVEFMFEYVRRTDSNPLFIRAELPERKPFHRRLSRRGRDQPQRRQGPDVLHPRL